MVVESLRNETCSSEVAIEGAIGAVLRRSEEVLTFLHEGSPLGSVLERVNLTLQAIEDRLVNLVDDVLVTRSGAVVPGHSLVATIAVHEFAVLVDDEELTLNLLEGVLSHRVSSEGELSGSARASAEVLTRHEVLHVELAFFARRNHLPDNVSIGKGPRLGSSPFASVGHATTVAESVLRALSDEHVVTCAYLYEVLVETFEGFNESVGHLVVLIVAQASIGVSSNSCIVSGFQRVVVLLRIKITRVGTNGVVLLVHLVLAIHFIVVAQTLVSGHLVLSSLVDEPVAGVVIARVTTVADISDSGVLIGRAEYPATCLDCTAAVLTVVLAFIKLFLVDDLSRVLVPVFASTTSEGHGSSLTGSEAEGFGLLAGVLATFVVLSVAKVLEDVNGEFFTVGFLLRHLDKLKDVGACECGGNVHGTACGVHVTVVTITGVETAVESVLLAFLNGGNRTVLVVHIPAGLRLCITYEEEQHQGNETVDFFH